MSDEAHFHLTGYVNKQNYRYWADSNPKEVHERPLHSSRPRVWCVISSRGVIGPYFFENVERITMTHFESVCWDAAIVCCTCIEQFSTTSRSLVSTVWCDIAHCKAINGSCRELFGDRVSVISRFGDIPWPPRSPDLSVYNFFLWGYRKNLIYTTRPRTLDELKRIQDEIRGIPPEMLQRAMGNLNGRLKKCIRGDGHHLQDVIFKHW